MIRNVVTGRLRDSAGPAESATLDAALAGIRALDLPGQRSMTVGRDAGLREGGWDFAVVNDWDDAAAYQAYDLDPEHNVHRAAVVAVCAQLSRVQLELPD